MTWPPGVPTKDELRRRLLAAYPWLDDVELGPRNVDAGECESCGVEARLVLTCGPGAQQLGRGCAAARGPDAWCEGHREDARRALTWLAELPAEADDVARLWWLATGEVSPGSAGERVVAALEEHQRVSATRSLLHAQHLPDDE